ncbi:hypothetical protein CISIN_1g0438201mg, partial [Citrus sinensis]
VVAAGICFAGTITGARIDARVVAARIVFAGSVTGIFFARSVTEVAKIYARSRPRSYPSVVIRPGYKVGLILELKPDPDPNPDRLHSSRVRSLQYPDPAQGFAIPSVNS